MSHVFAEMHPSRLEATMQVALAYYSSGQSRKGIELAENVVSVAESHLGLQHPFSQRAGELLAALEPMDG